MILFKIIIIIILIILLFYMEIYFNTKDNIYNFNIYKLKDKKNNNCNINKLKKQL